MVESRCGVCNKTFSTYPSTNKKYCSWDCRTEGIKGPGNPRAVQKIAKRCEICDLGFDVYPSAAPKTRYCSKACLGVANGRRKAALSAARRVHIACRVCDKPFTCYPSQVGRKKYCSRECAYAAMKTASDYKYGPDWSRQRLAARRRDQEMCQGCGVTGLIHVHHVVPYRIGKCNDLSNLICLCPSCHTRTEAALRKNERAAKTAA